MKKSTKGALAAGAAAVLLLGGAGSLAYWTAGGTVNGGAITAGNLALSAPDCGTAGWTYDAGEQVPGATYTPGTSLLVPGDVISKTCKTTLTATGEHMRGTIVASAPAAIAPFTVSVGTITGAAPALSGTGGNEFTEANNGNVLSIKISVTFPDTGAPASATTGDNAYKNATANLDNIALTATQVHS